MIIAIDKLAGLLSDDKFMGWLQRELPQVHYDVKQYLRSTSDRRYDGRKATEVYNAIQRDPDKLERFTELIKLNYQTLIVEDEPLVAKLMVHASIDVNKVFHHYNPLLLNFPMKLILQSSDAGKLKDGVRTLIADQATFDYLVIGRRAYIEYIPRTIAHLARQVPVDNWEINRFRLVNGIKRPSNILAELNDGK